MTEQENSAMISTAYHEAGHAVIGRVPGLVCGYATITPDDDTAGHAITADPWVTVAVWEEREKFRRQSSALRGRIFAYMAGAEAEIELLGKCEAGDSDDRYQIAYMLDSLLPWNYADPSRYEERLRSKARGLVRRHRETIERVASALLVSKRLSAKELDALT